MGLRRDPNSERSEALRFAALRALREIEEMDDRAAESLMTALMCAAWPTLWAQSQ